jgi:hypothetical protein
MFARNVSAALASSLIYSNTADICKSAVGLTHTRCARCSRGKAEGFFLVSSKSIRPDEHSLRASGRVLNICCADLLWKIIRLMVLKTIIPGVDPFRKSVCARQRKKGTT